MLEEVAVLLLLFLLWGDDVLVEVAVAVAVRLLRDLETEEILWITARDCSHN